MRPVLGQPTIPRFHMTELALDDAEGMLDLCTHLGDDPVDLFVDGVELAALGRLAHDAPDLAILAEDGLALGANIALARWAELLRLVEAESGKVYGYRKLTDDLRNQGERIFESRIIRLGSLRISAIGGAPVAMVESLPWWSRAGWNIG